MDNNNINDKDYYNAAQAALLSYDAKLWQIPALFIALVGLLIKDSNFNFTFQNGIIFLFGALALLILVLLHNKASIFHISISNKINEFDNFNDQNKNLQIKRIPLTSMNDEELRVRINELEKKELKKERNEGAEFNCVQKFLAHYRISSWIRNIMLITLFATLFFSIGCFLASS